MLGPHVAKRWAALGVAAAVGAMATKVVIATIAGTHSLAGSLLGTVIVSLRSTLDLQLLS
jgi:hypothetical protein